MIEPLFDLGMTDEQLKTIGTISLNWATVEREITDILRDFYALKDENDAIELITILELDKKLHLLQKKMTRDSKPSGYLNADWSKASDFLSRLRKSAEKFREGRNHIIHGSVVRFFGSPRPCHLVPYKKAREGPFRTAEDCRSIYISDLPNGAPIKLSLWIDAASTIA